MPQTRQPISLHVGDKTLTVRPSYIYCNICGHTPDAEDEPNYAPIRWWDPDDGWKIGTLCRDCADTVINERPSPEDYAYRHQDQFDDSGTDEDPSIALYGYAFEE